MSSWVLKFAVIKRPNGLYSEAKGLVQPFSLHVPKLAQTQNPSAAAQTSNFPLRFY